MTLYNAIEAGNLDEVIQIISTNPNAINEELNSTDNHGEGYTLTPLHVAAIFDEMSIAEWLLDHGAQIDATDQDDKTALHHAAIEGSIEVVRLLLERGAPITSYGGEDSALRDAATYGDTTIINLLLDHGADINHLNPSAGDKTALHEACMFGHVDAVNLLLERGARLGQRDGHGETPLMLAAEAGHTAVIQLLLDRGAETQITDTDPEGWTALHWAVDRAADHQDPFLHSYRNTIEVLIKHGANIHVVDTWQGLTPYEKAVPHPDLQEDMQAWYKARP